MTLLGKRIALMLGAAVIAPAAFACGGGGDTGPDDEYVTAFCNTQREFSDSLDAAIRGSSTTTNFDAIAEPFETLADDFDDLKPPDDLEDWHNDAAEKVSETADRVKDERNLEAVTSLERDPLSGMPEEPRERLRAIANDDPACEGLSVFEG
ncbi:MAG: hypothetical protein WED87_00010 [Dehalococcoidia bacterium]